MPRPELWPNDPSRAAVSGLDGPKADDPSLHLAAKSKRPVRVISFLGGPPSLGQGSLMDYLAKTKMLRSTRPERNKPTSPTSAEMEMGFAVGVDDVAETAQEPGMKKATSLASAFYEEASLVATSLGVSIDVFVISKAPVGLDVLSTIANNTGGGVWLYPSVQDAMLTQDLYRHLSSPHAQNCLLKVRTSPEFRVARLYGRVFKDPMYDDVYHMMSCDAFDVVTVDFEFVHKEGFGNPPAAVPTVQVAFQYTTVTADGQEPKLQRRMRICTIQAQVARNPVEIFNSANAESIICMLLHKVLAATEKEGKQQAALLLQDWLVILAASYDKLTHRHGEGQLHEQGQPFVPFEDCEALQAVPRLVYGLLRSPLMLGGQVGPLAHPDLPTFLRHQWTSLPPSHLHRAMYPQLSSYSSASAQTLPSHSLSVAAVAGTEAPIFLLDALTTVLVYYKRSCPPDLPFPPPPNSLLRTTVNELRQNRRMAPKYKAVRQGEDDAQLFEGRLIDEPLEAGKKLEGEAAAAFTGYFHFLEWLRGAAATLGSQEAD
ncbi:unnamed protein product [Ostreobium quekettii]|uniref:Sec23/Sec24 helical domain-containing protein n=1 Tax=Ostreobium quekettii TaxID=121088 RepID=A0A8S1JFL5_9CHLO|nr:unnamed protein product [Ostreobium quekettii]